MLRGSTRCWDSEGASDFFSFLFLFFFAPSSGRVCLEVLTDGRSACVWGWEGGPDATATPHAPRLPYLSLSYR